MAVTKVPDHQVRVIHSVDHVNKSDSWVVVETYRGSVIKTEVFGGDQVQDARNAAQSMALTYGATLMAEDRQVIA